MNRESEMTKLGYTLFSEINGPKELVSQAVQAEDAGFDFAVISDHFHPWIAEHSDSPFAWSVLGAVADRTETMELATLVTCPMIRYHPAIIAQAAATIQIMSDGRFTLALGAGENLNEHVVGRGWPPVDVRHAMLAESIEAMSALWEGGYVTYRGQHITVEDARIYSLPDEPPALAVAVSGDKSIELAVKHQAHLVGVEPDAGLVERYQKAGGKGRRIGQAALAYDRDKDKAKDYAMRFKFGVPGLEGDGRAAQPDQLRRRHRAHHLRRRGRQCRHRAGSEGPRRGGQGLYRRRLRRGLHRSGRRRQGRFHAFLDRRGGPTTGRFITPLM
jgi:G6PDH family F420-dependent oxidoreductase